MKLCQKCQDEIRKGTAAGSVKDFGYLYFVDSNPVSKSECEFWAHVGLRGLFEQQRKTQEVIRSPHSLVAVLASYQDGEVPDDLHPVRIDNIRPEE